MEKPHYSTLNHLSQCSTTLAPYSDLLLPQVCLRHGKSEIHQYGRKPDSLGHTYPPQAASGSSLTSQMLHNHLCLGPARLQSCLRLAPPSIRLSKIETLESFSTPPSSLSICHRVLLIVPRTHFLNLSTSLHFLRHPPTPLVFI